MITAALGELEQAGVTGRPGIAVADAQYWNEQHIDEVIANKHIQVLIPPDSGTRKTAPARLDRRALRGDAQRAGLTGRQGALPKTQTDDRARVRSHQAQPPNHPVPAKRPNRRADRVAVIDDDSQPDQAPPPPPRRHLGLKQPLAARTAHTVPADAERHTSAARRRRATRQPPTNPIVGTGRIGVIAASPKRNSNRRERETSMQ